MCSIRCRRSKSNICKCECGGLYHGCASDLPVPARVDRLTSTFPPCTPVRLTKPTLRGTTEGVVQGFRFFETGTIYIEFPTGEITSIENIETIGDKAYENSETNTWNAHV